MEIFSSYNNCGLRLGLALAALKAPVFLPVKKSFKDIKVSN